MRQCIKPFLVFFSDLLLFLLFPGLKISTGISSSSSSFFSTYFNEAFLSFFLPILGIFCRTISFYLRPYVSPRKEPGNNDESHDSTVALIGANFSMGDELSHYFRCHCQVQLILGKQLYERLMGLHLIVSMLARTNTVIRME